MAKRKLRPRPKVNGWVYLLKIWVNGEVVYKIGTTNRTPTVRMLEIAGELNQLLGHIPKMMLLQSKQTMNNYQVESAVLKATEKYKYRIQCTGSFSGESEIRKMCVAELLTEYNKCLLVDYPAIQRFKVEI